MLAAALEYASRGLFIFPLAAKTSIPRAGSRGLLDATTDLECIRKWWQADRRANIGVNCGASGLVVPDVDPRHGGDDTWHELCARFGDIVSLTSITPRGGSHFYFRAAEHVIASGTNVLGSGVDIRAQGGYVVAPPSRRADGAYVWEIDHGPGEIEPQPLPRWIVDVIATTRRRPPPKGPLPPKLLPNQRHDRLFRLGAMNRDKGCSEDEIFALLLSVNAGRCQPPLPERDIRTLARDIALRYAPQRNVFAPGDA